MEQKYLDQAENYPTLGPHYFAAREVVEKFMASFAAEMLEPLVKKFADETYREIHTRLEDYLLSDVENNLQGTIYRQVDESVNALLSNHKWAIERYVLGDRYDHDKVRETIAKLIPAELQERRVADLEAENKRLTEQLSFYRSR